MTKSPSVRRFRRSILCGLGLVFLGAAAFGQDDVRKAKIFEDVYPLITESDLYCSIFFWEGERPALRVAGAERQDEKNQFSDGDTCYLDKGRADGLEIGQVFQVVRIGGAFAEHGDLSQRLGRARVVRLDENRSVAAVEKTCNPVRIGDYLVPFEEKEGLLGRDQGFDDSLDPAAGVKGSVIYLDTDLKIGGTGAWAIIDIGRTAGLQPGQQLTVFRRARPDLPREAIGNIVVIDVQERSATIKILSIREALRRGDEVQTKS